MQDLSVCLVQTALHWEDRERNLTLFDGWLEKIPADTQLIVLPEMFTTGFSMETAKLAEENGGHALEWMKKHAVKRHCVITGSLMISDNGRYTNRLFWVYPDGRHQHYDKKHLFRFGKEEQHYSGGNERIITSAGDWKFCPQICYDLRFPTWNRNKYHDGKFEYDCLLFVANWPERRSHHWRSLLVARAIENMSYCMGLNRVGEDGNGIPHSGNSLAVDPLGKIYGELPDHEEGLIFVTLSASALEDWREKFKVALDWDEQ